MIIIQNKSSQQVKMEEDNYDNISLPDSELSMVSEGIYVNIPTAEITVNTSPEYSPTTEPISFSSSIENYLPSQPSNPFRNQIDEAPLTLPIEYLSAAREWLISMVMIREYPSPETIILTVPENNISTSSLPIQSSVSTFNFTLPTNEMESELQLEDWASPSFFETLPPITLENPSPFSTPSLSAIPTNQTLSTTIQNTNTEHYDNIIFNDIDQIVNHNRRWINGRRVMNMLCKLKNGEQRWVLTSQLRKDSRVSSLIDRYYRDLKHPYWAKRSSRIKAKRY